MCETMGVKAEKKASIFYLRSSVMVSGDQVFSHLHNILETVFACINFNFPGLMLFHQDLDSRNIPKVT